MSSTREFDFDRTGRRVVVGSIVSIIFTEGQYKVTHLFEGSGSDGNYVSLEAFDQAAKSLMKILTVKVLCENIVVNTNKPSRNAHIDVVRQSMDKGGVTLSELSENCTDAERQEQHIFAMLSDAHKAFTLLKDSYEDARAASEIAHNAAYDSCCDCEYLIKKYDLDRPIVNTFEY
tara:strand:- start:227 stop:751 length:525 start_codon:yes stop_codon:yes gene_type:complete